jgi:arylsulfatase A-like enzyme
MANWCLIRDGAFKLVAQRPELKPIHLFNLEADPYEMKDLVDDPTHVQTRENLFAKIKDWNSRVTKKAKERKP